MAGKLARRRGLSRRNLLKTTIAAVALAATGSLAGCDQIPLLGSRGPTKIIWAGQGGVYMESLKRLLWDPFAKENNVEFEFVAIGTSALLARLRAEAGATTMDYLGTGEGVAVAMRAEGLVDKMDAAKVPNLKNVIPAARNEEGYPPIGHFIANVVYYNSEFVKPAPTSWADLWKPEFKKKVSYPDIPNTTGLHMLLMAAKIAQGDTSPNTGEAYVNDKAFAKMKELLPNTYEIYGFQSAFDGMAALRSGEVWLHVDGLVGQRQTVLNQPGTPIKMMLQSKEGIPNSPLTLCYVKGSKVSPDLLNKLTNQYFTSEVSMGVTEASDYVPCIDAAYPPSLTGVLPTPGSMLKSNWKLITENRPAWTERWNKEILAAK